MRPAAPKTNLTPVASITGARVYFNIEQGGHRVTTNKQGFRLYNEQGQFIDFPKTDEYTLTTLAVSKISVRCKLGEIILLCGDRRRREVVLRKIQSKLNLITEKVA